MKVDTSLISKSGIYKITCKVTNKFYIGSSYSLYRRLQTHLRHLRNGIHKNKHLQSAFQKYGEESFIFEIIEFCSITEIINREQFFLDTLKPFLPTIGFNKLDKAGCVRKPVYSVTFKNLKTGEIKNWNSRTEASLELRCNTSHIANVVLGTVRSVKGWGLLDTVKYGSGNFGEKSITLQNLKTGEIKKWNSHKLAAGEIGNGISELISGKIKRVRDWTLLVNFTKCRFTLENKEHKIQRVWFKQIDAAKDLNCSDSSIRNLLRGRIKNLKGWTAVV